MESEHKKEEAKKRSVSILEKLKEVENVNKNKRIRDDDTDGVDQLNFQEPPKKL